MAWSTPTSSRTAQRNIRKRRPAAPGTKRSSSIAPRPRPSRRRAAPPQGEATDHLTRPHLEEPAQRRLEGWKVEPPMQTKPINAPDAPAPAGGYVQALEVTGAKRLLFV